MTENSYLCQKQFKIQQKKHHSVDNRTGNKKNQKKTRRTIEKTIKKLKTSKTLRNA